jgi:BlaI family transcriptional regulator, penicillinase repressor
MIDAGHQRQYSLHMRRFTPGELSVMRLLWEHDALKPSEIQKLYPEPIKNPALRSYLKILLDKGHVKRRKAGKAYAYQAVTPKRTAFRSTLRDLIDAYCEGSTLALMVNLIRAEKLSEEELVHLKRLADETQPP